MFHRGETLEQLYRSLQKQDFHDFEWLVVDDGSGDDTEKRFEKILREKKTFSVRYLKTENGGKHRAINLGVREAKGRLFYIVDSDDYLPERALSEIIRWEKTIPDETKNQFAGICGVKCFDNGKPIGEIQKEEILDITALQRPAYGIQGDKAEVFYLDVLKKYPFPTFEGEKFLTEAVVWDRIAWDGFLLRYVQTPFMICEYRPDGLSARMAQLNSENTQGYGLYLSQSAALGKIKGMEKWNSYLEFFYSVRDVWSFRRISEVLHESCTKLRTVFLGIRIYNKLTHQ